MTWEKSITLNKQQRNRKQREIVLLREGGGGWGWGEGGREDGGGGGGGVCEPCFNVESPLVRFCQFIDREQLLPLCNCTMYFLWRHCHYQSTSPPVIITTTIIIIIIRFSCKSRPFSWRHRCWPRPLRHPAWGGRRRRRDTRRAAKRPGQWPSGPRPRPRLHRCWIGSTCCSPRTGCRWRRTACTRTAWRPGGLWTGSGGSSS